MSNNNDWVKVGSKENNNPSWKPEKAGDEIAGLLVDTKEITYEGTPKQIYTLQKEDGTFIDVWGNKNLGFKMEKIGMGDTIKIVFLGKEKMKDSAFKFNSFEVFMKPANDTSEANVNADDSEEVTSVDAEEIPF